MANNIPDEFVPLHVHYRRDRAIRASGPDAELLFLRALAFARAHRTGGAIEDFDLDDIGAGIPHPERAAATLVRLNLWIANGTGWAIRSWEKWNPSGSSEAGVYGNHKRWHLDRGIVAPDCPLCPTEPPEESPPTRGDHRGESGAIIGATSGGIAEVEGEEKREEEKPHASLALVGPLTITLDPSKPAPRKATNEILDADFAANFWPEYPRKVAPAKAKEAYRAARREASLDAILAGLASYKRTKPDYADWAYPATWLNGDRWLDETEATTTAPVSRTVYIDDVEGLDD